VYKIDNVCLTGCLLKNYDNEIKKSYYDQYLFYFVHINLFILTIDSFTFLSILGDNSICIILINQCDAEL
jgi:hypothetical protein